MDVVLRLKKSYRNLALTCLPLYLCLMAVLFFGLLVEGSILGAVVAAAFWGFWVVLCAIILVAYYRESLSIQDGRIVQTGIFHRREMAFAEVVHLHWRLWPAGGVAVLRSASEKIKVTFANFEPEQRRWLIRELRRLLPSSIQQDWERFCVRNALPLAKERIDAPLEAGEILLTRQRWDRFFVVLTVIMAAVAAVCAWLFRIAEVLFLPLACLVFWPIMRFSVPRTGARCTKVLAAGTPQKRFLLFLLISGTIGATALVPLGNNHQALSIGLMLLWYAALLHQGFLLNRRAEAAKDAMASVAAEEWERLETPTNDANAPGSGNRQ